MVSRWCSLVLVLVSLGVVLGCATSHIEPVRFRTMQPESAFDRVVAAMKVHGGGVREVNPEAGMVRSRWYHTGFNYGYGKQISYYFIAMVAQNPKDRSADVSLRAQVLLCGVADRKLHPEDLESRCEPGPVVPSEVNERFERLKRHVKEDVFRSE